MELVSTICFLSDFGLDDTWVGVCHAVMHAVCPNAHVVDLSHGVPPFDIRKAAAVAASGVHQLPDAVHLVVVDPGVGGPRRDLCLVCASGTMLVGPDNGVLVPAAERCGGVARAYSLDASRLSETPPAPTFHARDVLAPAAGALACGVEPSALGDRIDVADLAGAPFPPCSQDGSLVLGEVLEADRFGSVRFNIPSEKIDQLGLRARWLEIGLGVETLAVPFARTFDDVGDGDPVALIDASGWLTLAVNRGSAQETYGISPGTAVTVRPR